MDVVSTSVNGMQFSPLTYLSSVYVFLASVCCTIGKYSAFQISLLYPSLYFICFFFISLLSRLSCCFCLLYYYTSTASVILLPLSPSTLHCHVVTCIMETVISSPWSLYCFYCSVSCQQCGPYCDSDCNNNDNNYQVPSPPSLSSSSLLYLLSLLQCLIEIYFIFIFLIGI